jgi:hypothetical protein
VARKKKGKFSRFHKNPFPNEVEPADQKTIDREAARIQREQAEPVKTPPPEVKGLAVGLLMAKDSRYSGLVAALSNVETEDKLDLKDLIA